MANEFTTVTLYLENIEGVAATMTVNEDSLLEVPPFVDKTCKKRAGDLVVGEALIHASASFKIVTQP